MKMNETDEEINKASEEGFSLIDNSEIIDSIPNAVKMINVKRMEMFDFFKKIPSNKAMRVKFPNEEIWKLYNQRLRFYAADYDQRLTIHARKQVEGYFIYIYKKVDEEDEHEKNLEVKSV